MSELNPLRWKREHRIALLVAAGIGGTIGLVHCVRIGLAHPGMCNTLHVWFVRSDCRDLVLYPELWWPLFGALLGAAVVYVWGLMRA